MAENDIYIKEATAIISHELALTDEESLALIAINNYEVLKIQLAEKIDYLLKYDIEKLRYVLYRIDINEQKVKDALANFPIEESVLHIAELILQREIQKAISRKQYAAVVVDPDLAL